MAKNTVISPTTEKYTARKMNKLLIHTKVWMPLKKLKLPEKKKKEKNVKFYMKTIYCRFYLYVILQTEGKQKQIENQI